MVMLRYRDLSIRPLLDGALATLAGSDGFVEGWVGRSPDDPDLWVLGAHWRDVGAMRRGLGSYPAKMALGPLQAFSAGGDSVIEILTHHDGTTPRSHASDRAADADQSGPR